MHTKYLRWRVIERLHVRPVKIVACLRRFAFVCPSIIIYLTAVSGMHNQFQLISVKGAIK